MAIKRLFSGGVLCALFFLALGSMFVGRTGIEEDEAIFASPLFRDWCFFAIPLKHGRIPIMHMSYVGALKTWLYTPIAMVWAPSAAMLRVPALVLGTLTIFLFWKLLDAAYGRRAAWTGCVLLSTDTIFMLTSVFDWGPVAIQHLLLAAVLLCGFRWSQKGGNAWLFAAALCSGLAFWDKAVFVWMFTGLAAGCLVFWRLIFQRFTRARVAIVVAGLCLGALPLIVYNFSADPRFATIRSNAKLTPHAFRRPMEELRMTWNGSGLFGFMVYETSDRPNSPNSALERASFAVHQITGVRRTGYFEFALLASLILLPLLWRTPARNAMLFAFIATGVAWIAMVLLDGGSSVHHAVLLSPLPHLFVAIAFAEASRHLRFGNWALTAAISLVALTSLLVTNQYLFQFARNGAAGRWTDAIYPLAAALRETQATQVALVDWGAQDPLSFLNKDQPPVRTISDPFMPSDEPAAQKQADSQLLFDPGIVWAEYAPGSEISNGINDRLLGVARREGLEQVVLGTFCDRNGRPIFQTFRFRTNR